jgi:hypothetical protein
MTDDEIKATAMALVEDFNLPLSKAMVVYEQVAAFGIKVARNFRPATKAGVQKGGTWSDEAKARLYNNPVRLAVIREMAAKGRAALAAKRAAKKAATQ